MSIYVVSGYMRSGTSMMMDALTAGGLNPAFNETRNYMNNRWGDDSYKPNPNGFYELSHEEYKQDGFPGQYEGKLLKILWSGLPKMIVNDYKVVFMKRDPEEIRQSYEAFFKIKHRDKFNDWYKKKMQETIDLLHYRKDTESLIMDYRYVVDNPYDAFNQLKKNGWDIDCNLAAQKIDPKLHRFKIEHLTVGI